MKVNCGFGNADCGLTGASEPSIRKIRSSFRNPQSPFRNPAAFTLVEIVIALTIVVIITAAAIPSFRGFRDEQLAREPVTPTFYWPN